MIPPQYAPDESEAVRFSERTWLQGAFISVLAYGMQVILYSMSCYWLYKPKARNAPISKENIVLMVYITIIFVLGTLYIAGLLQFTQDAFIDGRNIPGGPSAYETVMFSVPIDMLPNVIMVLLSWMCDIINVGPTISSPLFPISETLKHKVWRCVVVYRGSNVPIWAVCTIPALLYVGSVSNVFFTRLCTFGCSPSWFVKHWEYVSLNRSGLHHSRPGPPQASILPSPIILCPWL